MVDYANMKSYSSAVKKRLRSIVKAHGIEEEIAEYYRETSRKRKFKGLTRKTIASRKRMSRYNKTHADYSNRRSNLTFSGQLIDSIKGYVRVSKSAIELIPRGRRKPYRLKSGKRSKSRPLNVDVVRGQEDQGRFLMIPTKKQRIGIIKIFRSKLRRVLKS